MIIDAKRLVLGRLATFAAKKALLGEKVDIVNCELAVISGDKQKVFEEYRRRREQGTFKGPFLHRSPDRFVRRVVRGMLPYKQFKGRSAFDRVMCYKGVPPIFQGKEMVTVKGAEVGKLPTSSYLTVGAICKNLGGKI